ncbi:MAG: ATP-binding protein, partial [Gammaproteobacteria bacterium]|nr:ATP-binding protein [Gammaproteobacteria bacterium]
MAVQLAAPSEDYPYQVSESLRQRLDLVHHLVEFGRQVIIVRGPRGSGRSRLLRTIAEEAAGDWLAVLVDGGGHVSAAAFARAWGETLGAAMDEDVGNLAGLREALQRLGRQRRRCVLLVDDADALEDEAVGLLQAIANDPLDYADTRVVLAVEDDDEDDFAAFFEEGVSGVGLVHVVEVPPLDLAGIRGLAAAWSTLIGLPASVVLPEDAVETVAAESDGRPGRVLECLAGRLERGQPSEQEIFGGFELPARLKRVGGITVLILAALGLVALALSQREGAPRQAERQGPTVIDLDLPGRAEATATAPPGTADAAAKPAQAGASTANLPARTDTRSALP